MRGRALIWITVIQVAAAVGTAILPTPAASHASTAATMRTVCTRLQEPSATALRMFVDQTRLRQSASQAPWAMLVTLFALPLNIFLWSTLWRRIAGGGMTWRSDEDWTSRTLQRDTIVLPMAGVQRTWSFPSSMKPAQRR